MARRITRELAAIVKVDKFREQCVLCVLNNSDLTLSYVMKLTELLLNDT